MYLGRTMRVKLSVFFAISLLSSASLAQTVTDWTSFTSSTATGTLAGTTVSGTQTAGAIFGGIYTSIFSTPGSWDAPLPLSSTAEAIEMHPVNAGSQHGFTFSTPVTGLRFYIENFDSASNAVISANGATSIAMIAASPSMSFTPLTASSGNLVTSNTTFNGEGDAVLEFGGPVQAVSLTYSNGLLSNSVFYTFVVPEPSTLGVLAIGVLNLRRLRRPL